MFKASQVQNLNKGDGKNRQVHVNINNSFVIPKLGSKMYFTTQSPVFRAREIFKRNLVSRLEGILFALNIYVVTQKAKLMVRYGWNPSEAHSFP